MPTPRVISRPIQWGWYSTFHQRNHSMFYLRASPPPHQHPSKKKNTTVSREVETRRERSKEIFYAGTFQFDDVSLIQVRMIPSHQWRPETHQDGRRMISSSSWYRAHNAVNISSVLLQGASWQDVTYTCLKWFILVFQVGATTRYVKTNPAIFGFKIYYFCLRQRPSRQEKFELSGTHIICAFFSHCASRNQASHIPNISRLKSTFSVNKELRSNDVLQTLCWCVSLRRRFPSRWMHHHCGTPPHRVLAKNRSTMRSIGSISDKCGSWLA